MVDEREFLNVLLLTDVVQWSDEKMWNVKIMYYFTLVSFIMFNISF